MFIERMPGLAEVILSNFTFGPNDLLMIFAGFRGVLVRHRQLAVEGLRATAR